MAILIRKVFLLDKYLQIKENNELQVAEEVSHPAASAIEIIDSIYDSRSMQPGECKK